MCADSLGKIAVPGQGYRFVSQYVGLECRIAAVDSNHKGRVKIQQAGVRHETPVVAVADAKIPLSPFHATRFVLLSGTLKRQAVVLGLLLFLLQHTVNGAQIVEQE